MRYLKRMRQAGWILFGIMWIPFATIFIGMIGVPEGSYDWIELPPLARYSMTAVGVLMAGSMILLFGSMVLGMVLSSRIRKTGEPALARVLEIHDTGTTVNEDPLIRLVLEVHPEQGTPFIAETEQLVSRLAVPQFQPGQEVLVKYDPENGEVALID